MSGAPGLTAVLLALAVGSGAFGLGAIVLHVWPTFVGVRHERWGAGDVALFVVGPMAVLASLWLWSEWWRRWSGARLQRQRTSRAEEGRAEEEVLGQRGRASADRT